MTAANLRRLMGAAALVVVTSACGVVKIVDPRANAAGGHGRREATTWVNACTLLQKAEVEAAVGVPVEEPEHTAAVDNLYGSTCEWRAGRAVSVTAWVDSGTHGPDEDDGDDAADLKGIGRSAWASEGTSSVVIGGHTDVGQGFSVNVAKLGASPAELRPKAIELVRHVAARTADAYPGKQEAIPRRLPELDTCALLPATERVRILGWAARADQDDAFSVPLLHRTGGPGGGGHYCVLTDRQFTRFITVDVSSGPVDVATASREAEALDAAAVGRQAFYQPVLSADHRGTSGFGESTLRSLLDDGRMVTLTIGDRELDEARSRDLLTQLMRVAVAAVPSAS